MTHNAVSGVAHFAAENDEECLQLIRELRDTRFDLLIARWDDAVSLGSDGIPSPPILPVGDGLAVSMKRGG